MAQNLMSTAAGDALCVPRPSSGLNPNQPVLVHSEPPKELPENHILIKVDRFGFSANNITYQALGEAPHFRYFEFHHPPTTDVVSSKTHGLIPVWGFGTIVASTCAKVPAGERIYGYLAPARYLLAPIHPSSITKYALYVPRPHLPADRRPYNMLTRCATDAQYSPEPALEDLTMLYRPLFWTAYWCEDWLEASSYRGGASRMLISSASAKTAFCLAYLVRKRARGVRLVGLTSAKNRAFTAGLGLYDEVTTYDALERLQPGTERWLYVDVAGNDALNARVFKQFARADLAASVQLGLSSLSPSAPDASSDRWTENTALAAPQAARGALEQFFMPEWLAVRRRQLSIQQITEMQKRAWDALMRDCRGWVRVERVCGGQDVKRAYEGLAAGGMGPEKGYIWSMWDAQEAKL